MNPGSWNWDSLIDVICNLLGVLLLLSAMGLFLRALQASQTTEITEIGELPTHLPIVQILSTQGGLFPVSLVEVYRHFLKVTPSSNNGDLVGQTVMPAGHGSVAIEYVTDASGIDSCLLLKPVGKGCTTREVIEDACPGFIWSNRQAGKEVLFFNVYPGGYDFFQPLCVEAALLGFETGWKPRPEGEPAFLCKGNRRWIDKHVQGGRQIASQSCFWLLSED
jgi:hypothetical protein